MRFQKGLLAVACMTMLSIGAVSVFAANQSKLGQQGAFSVERREKLPVVNQGAAIAGNAFYVNLSEVSGFWFSAGYTTHAYFYHDAVTDVVAEEHAWVTGFVAVPGDSNVYEITVPSGYTEGHPWTNVIVCRANASNWEGVVNEGQTGNMVINSSGQNGVTVQNSTWYDEGEHKQKRSASSFTYTAETRLLKWIDASGNGSWTNSGICDSEGLTDKDDLESAWEASETSFSNIKGADVKSYFSNLTAKEASAGGNTVEDIAARYDHIRSAHPTWTLDDFAQRG